VERNRWETAIRCLEIALHPRTSDDEVIAAVNGFRRTADGTPLREVCAEFAAMSAAGAASAEADTLQRENLEMQGRLARHRAAHVDTLRRLHEAERHIRELSEEIRAEKQNFEDFRTASARVVEGLKDENFDLREALEQVRPTVREPAASGAQPFRDFLTAAINSAPASGDPPASGAGPHRPWKA
jgi:TolA-binding protein